MEECDLELLFKYPHISRKQSAKGCKIYEGFLYVLNQDIRLSITEIVEDNDFTFSCQIEPEEAAVSIKNTIEREKPKSIVECLDIVKSHFGSHLKPIKNYTDAYSKVLHEYNEFNNFYFSVKKSELSKDLSSIKVEVLDQKNRPHSLVISVDLENLEKMFHITRYDLPSTMKNTFLPNSSLIELFDVYVSVLDSLQFYFDLMDNLDGNACILDPEKPKRADAYRRIWLEENLSVIITVEPLKSYTRPDIKFLGPDRLVDEYRAKLNTNLELWMPENNTFENILCLLGLSNFPKKEKLTSGEYLLRNTEDCAICFSARYNERLPDVICENKCCENFYHSECLYEWLISIDGKRIFNEIHGQCPNCEKSISCGIPTHTPG